MLLFGENELPVWPKPAFWSKFRSEKCSSFLKKQYFEVLSVQQPFSYIKDELYAIFRKKNGSWRLTFRRKIPWRFHKTCYLGKFRLPTRPRNTRKVIFRILFFHSTTLVNGEGKFLLVNRNLFAFRAKNTYFGPNSQQKARSCLGANQRYVIPRILGHLAHLVQIIDAKLSPMIINIETRGDSLCPASRYTIVSFCSSCTTSIDFIFL